jgi:acetylornithine deacetylase/succinyl-diaminopimelate desuccinylase-like protein
VPVLAKLGDAELGYDLTAVAAALVRGLGGNPHDPVEAVGRIAETDPGVAELIEPLLSVTMAPTMVRASHKINVIPSRAEVKVDCRVPPGLGTERVEQRIAEVLGENRDAVDLEFTEIVSGNESPLDTPLMGAISRWVEANDHGAATVPMVLSGGSDSRWFREAFPDCVAYGFFPQRHMGILQTGPLVHAPDERIDVRDLGFAARFFRDIAREVLGSGEGLATP